MFDSNYAMEKQKIKQSRKKEKFKKWGIELL